jgi:hypothetical protein
VISVVIRGERIPFSGLARYSLPQKKYRAMILSAFRFSGEILPSEEISVRCFLYKRSIHTIRRHVRAMCDGGELERVRVLKNRRSIWAYRVKP